jgi:DNA-directed RNA polymerase specialized sigma subunit
MPNETLDELLGLTPEVSPGGRTKEAGGESLDEALEGYEKLSSMARADQDRFLLKKWKDSGEDPEHLKPLLTRYEPFIAKKTTEISRGATLVNPDATKLQVTAKVIEAFRTYDERHNTALNTHVQNRAQGALRTVIRSANMARIPEDSALQIGKIQRARAAHEEDFGVAPSYEELSRSTRIPVSKLKRIDKAQVRDMSSGGFEAPVIHTISARDREILPLLRERLSAEDKRVYDELYGSHVVGVPGTNDIAKKLGMSAPQVSQSKTRIAKLYKENT